ncbi:hypothetical protein DCAR_0728624 [Daucus carota subsp. sativus]|uniref:F-box domain-containing protein n=1 Tax=Daucus carota subsp. sativus TaxID=79200 RepID=A0A161ZKZ3_DAUCS|nr:PREDICTED: putative F-box/LRR-repeat protein 9 [Daucus carota subsp. sativus]XP_017216273.1 PREDICTED: putative F-box/LRR-repeat protein 9 [Daucus carota subsp. sativus]WOH09169.1 hypothetical protein DCAR_0728624 [Daucus carota subsp. sativus]
MAKSLRNWVELPPELTSSILVRLGAVEVLMSARKVCKKWRQICSDPEMWRVVDIRYSDCERSPQLFKHVFKKAVELSCGQLLHLHLQISGDHLLLPCVFDRLIQLRYLYLSCSSKIMSEGLSKMLERLPLLEELHLDCGCNIKKAIEIAGRCCPHLNSLKLINKSYLFAKVGCDEDALAIAENMPGLRRLQLYGPNKMTSDGLLAILDNCPHLESLDVCHNVANIKPDLVRRLSQQIKDLRLSYDSVKRCRIDLDYLHFLNEHLSPSAISATDTDDLNTVDEDDCSGLSGTNTVSNDYNDISWRSD